MAETRDLLDKAHAILAAPTEDFSERDAVSWVDFMSDVNGGASRLRYRIGWNRIWAKEGELSG